MHKHCSVLVLTILLTEDGQRCKKKKEDNVHKVLNMSELLIECHSCLVYVKSCFALAPMCRCSD